MTPDAGQKKGGNAREGEEPDVLNREPALPARQLIDACAAERDFLLARMERGDHTWVGISSNAMVVHVIAGRDGMPPANLWPHDRADLARCEMTYDRAPLHLLTAMAPIINRWRRHIDEGGLYCRGCDNSIGHHWTRADLCPECHDAQAAAY